MARGELFDELNSSVTVSEKKVSCQLFSQKLLVTRDFIDNERFVHDDRLL